MASSASSSWGCRHQNWCWRSVRPTLFTHANSLNCVAIAGLEPCDGVFTSVARPTLTHSLSWCFLAGWYGYDYTCSLTDTSTSGVCHATQSSRTSLVVARNQLAKAEPPGRIWQENSSTPHFFYRDAKAAGRLHRVDYDDSESLRLKCVLRAKCLFHTIDGRHTYRRKPILVWRVSMHGCCAGTNMQRLSARVVWECGRRQVSTTAAAGKWARNSGMISSVSYELS